MLNNILGTNGAYAELPTVGYPAGTFWGMGPLAPNGNAGVTQSGQPAVQSTRTGHLVLIIAVIAIGGYILFHWNSR